MNIKPIAIAHTPFREKFAIPRQPQLAPAARSRIELIAPFNDPHAFIGLEKVSHIWLLFVFHEALTNADEPPHLRVRPPRLGGNEKMGVFATRSTHRPNNIGQSVVKLEKIDGTTLWVSGADLLDGTPIIDIKPYVPYSDCVPTAYNHIASEPPSTIEVTWQAKALDQARCHGERLREPVIELIEQCLKQDPKPAYQTPTPEREYGVQFWDINIRWHYPSPDRICVLSVKPIEELK